MFTAKDVKELREKTGCGMMDCKKALTESDGDMEKAMELLREKGLAAATKKAGRIAAEGIVSSYTSDDASVGAIIEVNSETDFVGKNADFKAFVGALAKIVADSNPADLEALNALKFDDTKTVEEELREKILTIGENMKIRRFARFEGNVVTYIHGEGRIGVMVKVEGDLTDDAKAAAKDAAMQIAAMNPLYLDKTTVPAEDLEKEKHIILAQMKEDPKNAGKPENILEKMLTGKVNKFYELNCLNQQEFVKDSNYKVEKYLAEKGIKLVDFVRFEKGEGLEKKEENFADEVASMMK
ncbi:translation elongation factor Ts [Qingrenia yutianensis]|uniref:Elongation factor Ts n=1 Tax=Qingrenia yutianensis TaxID=2763676 RepID=A0A926IT33_9FIRM|nr:translation elongation factor Ts [Qingrenia yutianensis]MBC8596671.1 elongation factor Ts [Qingrenia yutianensis]